MVRARKLLKRGVRERTREFLIEGTTGIREAILAGVSIDVLFLEHPAEKHASLLFSDGKPNVRVLEVTPEVMGTIAATQTPPGELAVGRFIDKSQDDIVQSGPSKSVVLLDVRDPGNVGTILRTAWAVGVEAVFLGIGSADLYNPKVVRASAGAVFNLPIAREVEGRQLIDQLRSRDIKIIAADPKGDVVYDKLDMTTPCAFIFGNEAWGLTEDVLGMADEIGTIPINPAAESINVAVAAAAFLFEAARQTRALS